MIEKKISWDLIEEVIKRRFDLKEFKMMHAHSEGVLEICEMPEYIIGEINQEDMQEWKLQQQSKKNIEGVKIVEQKELHGVQTHLLRKYWGIQVGTGYVASVEKD